MKEINPAAPSVRDQSGASVCMDSATKNADQTPLVTAERKRWGLSMSQVSVEVVDGGFVLRGGLSDGREVPISEDMVFALGELFGMFEPFDGGFDTDGTRLMFTRRVLLEQCFGDDWVRYARARCGASDTPGLMWRIQGLPRVRKIARGRADRSECEKML